MIYDKLMSREEYADFLDMMGEPTEQDIEEIRAALKLVTQH